MATTTGTLKARQVDALPEGFHSDGGNLYLRVKESGARAWVFRYKQAGKVREIGLGPTHTRGLAEARERAAGMRRAVQDGMDPASLIHRKDPTRKTFQECAEELIEAKRPGWRNAKHAQQWSNTLSEYVYPPLGAKDPADVGLADVKAILLPLWATKTETATRLRQRIEAVLDYAAVHDLCDGTRNPARWKGMLDKVLPKPDKVRTRNHFTAAAYSDVPRVMAALREKAHVSALCLRFIILTACRSGEGRGAMWSEIDMDAELWTIPPSRMKAGKPHRVALPAEALAILQTMKELKREGCEWVFPGARVRSVISAETVSTLGAMNEPVRPGRDRVTSTTAGGLLSDVAVNKTLHSVCPGVTVHGFRSAFRDWAAEQTSFPARVCELCLAHGNPDKVEAAYQRSDLFAKRRELLTAWSRFCAAGSQVVQLVKAA